MKAKSIYRLLCICALMAFTACSITEKVTISGPSRTEIYTPYKNDAPAASIPASGQAKLFIPSDMYCGYIIAHDPSSGLKIPVGLDYKIKKHTGAKMACVGGYTLAIAGAGGAGVLGIAAALGAEGVASIAAIGGGVGLSGLGVASISQSRLRQVAYDYNFGYVKSQNLQIPPLSATLLHTDPPKESENDPDPDKAERRRATSGVSPTSDTNNSSKVSGSRSDLGKKVSGEYLGSGSLLLGNRKEEQYPEISVIIEPKDKNHVYVRVVESGEDYFDAPLLYLVHQENRGKYQLEIENLPQATITITKNGVLEFKHLKVNIDNTMYTLKITAAKAK